MSLRYNRKYQRGGSTQGASQDVTDLLNLLSGGALGEVLTADPSASPIPAVWGPAAAGSTTDIQQRADADKATAPTAANGVLTVQSIHDDGTIVVWERPDDATPFTVSATSVPGDGNPDLYPVVERANVARDVAPTAVEAPNPKDGDMAPVLLADGTRQYFLYSGGAFQTPAQITVEPAVPAEIDTTGPFTGAAPSGVKFGLDVANQKIYGVDGAGNYAEIITGVGSIEELDFVTANADLFVAPVDGDLANPATTLRVVKIDDATDTVVYWERASAPGVFTIAATTDDSIDTAYFDIQAADGDPLTTLPTVAETATNVLAGSIARKTFLPSRYIEVYRHTGLVWALDYVVPADLNAQTYPVDRLTATADNTPPTAGEVAAPKLGDVALVKYPSGRVEAYKHDGSTWGAPVWFILGIPTATAQLVTRSDASIGTPPTSTISTVVRISAYHPNGTIELWTRPDDTTPFTLQSTNVSGDGNADVLPPIIEPTDNTRGVLPTAAQTPTPKLGDVVEKRLPDGTVELYEHDGNVWALVDTVEPVAVVDDRLFPNEITSDIYISDADLVDGKWGGWTQGTYSVFIDPAISSDAEIRLSATYTGVLDIYSRPAGGAATDPVVVEVLSNDGTTDPTDGGTQIANQGVIYVRVGAEFVQKPTGTIGGVGGSTDTTAIEADITALQTQVNNLPDNQIVRGTLTAGAGLLPLPTAADATVDPGKAFDLGDTFLINGDGDVGGIPVTDKGELQLTSGDGTAAAHWTFRGQSTDDDTAYHVPLVVAPAAVPAYPALDEHGTVIEIQLQPTYELQRTNAVTGVKPTFGAVGNEIETTPVANSVARILLSDDTYDYWPWDGTDFQPGTVADYPAPYTFPAPALTGLKAGDKLRVHSNVGPDESSSANPDKYIELNGLVKLNGSQQASEYARIVKPYGWFEVTVNEAGDGWNLIGDFDSAQEPATPATAEVTANANGTVKNSVSFIALMPPPSNYPLSTTLTMTNQFATSDGPSVSFFMRGEDGSGNPEWVEISS